MAEYISKEYVINKCKEHRELYISAWGDFSAMPKEDKATCDAYATCWADVVNAPAADVQPVDRWISCKDKMPEDNTLVLFVYVSQNGVKSVHYGYHQTLKGLGSSWAKPSGGWHYYDDDITHWQPLPEPPKDGDTNG